MVVEQLLESDTVLMKGYGGDKTVKALWAEGRAQCRNQTRAREQRESSISDQGSTDSALGTEQGLRAARETGAKNDLGRGGEGSGGSIWGR